jgi:cobalt/nickel transport system permease protein
MVPGWLLTREEYEPRVDRDAFVDRSIRAFLRVLGGLRPAGETPAAGRSFNAGVKLASALLLVLLVSLSRGMIFPACAGTLLLAVLSVHPAPLILKVLRTSLSAAAFTFVLMLPAAIGGSPGALLAITARVSLSVAAMKLFALTTEWSSLTSSLGRIFVPGLFILVLDITVRYLAGLGGIALDMLTALKLRSVGRNDRKTAALSGVAGVLFLKSRRMAEDLSAAMACRCFTGSFRGGRPEKLSAWDLVIAAVDGLLIAAFVFTGA